jgi:hypothetical protein
MYFKLYCAKSEDAQNAAMHVLEMLVIGSQEVAGVEATAQIAIKDYIKEYFL